MRTQLLSAGIQALALSLLAVSALRADDATRPHLSADQRATVAASLKWQTGAITLKDGLAKLNLTPDFRFLDHDDADKVLHDAADVGPLDHGPWGIVISYEEGGYVKDDDAEKINYTELLAQMQKEIQEENPERVKAGYQPLTLIGWAAPPRYDKSTHKLYWAKELQFGDYPRHALNYDIRVLGRRGVLVLNAVAPMADFAAIDQKIPSVLAMVDFQPGNTYADFDPKIDKVAEYGLATLIAGGALAGAAKLGLFGLAFKWIIAAVLALKKLIIVAVIAIVAGVKKLWAKFTGKSSTPDRLLPPESRK